MVALVTQETSRAKKATSEVIVSGRPAPVKARGTTTTPGPAPGTSTGAAEKARTRGAAGNKVPTKTTVPANGRVRAKRAMTASLSEAWHPAIRTQLVTEAAGGTRRAADLLEVAASQPSRWAKGESVPGPAQARMLVDIDHVLAHALLVWADAGVARDWLTTANAHLGGVRPIEWIRLHGTAEVVEALRAEAAGSYA